MKVEYTYSIINVDQDAKTMEIVYDSPVYGVLHVGARLPWEDETVEDIVRMYNPSLYWLERTRPTLNVTPGLTGSQSIGIDEPDEPDEPLTLEQKRELAVLSRMAFMLSLEEQGLYEEASAAATGGDVDKSARIMWENASQFERMHPTLIQFAQALGYTDEQLDAIFYISEEDGDYEVED